MDLTFTSGTSRQQTQWRQALDRLLNLPMKALPLSIEVSFVAPAEVTGGHLTDLAATTWTYGSSSSTTKVRNDAPGYGNQRQVLEALAAKMGLKYNADIHFNETAAHELGHSFFAALPEERRIAIAQMFGAESDSLAEIAPSGAAWEDRIIEGIAETFKEAFLPRRHRVFPNRTNRRIPYSKFPEFRSHWRLAAPEIEADGGELGPGEAEVPSYDLDIFAQGDVILEEPFANPLPGVEGKHGLWQSSFGNIESGPFLHNAQLQHAFEWEGWVKDGTVLTYEFTVPASKFATALIGDPYFEPKALLSEYNECGYGWRFLKKKKAAEFFNVVHEAQWLRTLRNSEQIGPGGELVGEFWLYGDAAGGGVPTVTFKRSITVDSSNFSETRKCNGEIYRRVMLFGSLTAFLTIWLPENETEWLRIRNEATYPWMPTLKFTQKKCGAGSGEVGEPIDVPKGLVIPGDRKIGTRVSGRPVAGN